MSPCCSIQIACVCAVLAFLTQPAFGQETPSCEAKANESADRSTITCENQKIDVLKQPTSNILHAVATLSHTGGESNALSLVIGSSSPQFTRIDTATALIDSERHEFKASYTNGNLKGGIAIEQVVVVLPAEQTTAIRKADNFWIRLNAAVFDLTPMIDQMQRIDEMRSESETSP